MYLILTLFLSITKRYSQSTRTLYITVVKGKVRLLKPDLRRREMITI